MSIDLRLLIKNGVHFGHQTSRWNPKMEPYIWGHKNGIYLIDVSKTAYLLDQAAKFLETTAAEGRTILWVGTKKSAQDIVEKTANELKLPYVVHRWVGGTFTNFRQVRKSIANLLHYEDILVKTEESHYTKKELNLLKKRVGRLDNIVGGIRNLTWPVGAVVVVDVRKEHVVVKEAEAMGIPVVAIVDTNSDPSGVNYVIPANDDAPRSVTLLIEYLGQAAQRGLEIAAQRPKDQLPVLETFETLYEAPGMESEEDEEKKRAGAGARRKRPVPQKRPVNRPAPRAQEAGAKEEKAEEVQGAPKAEEAARSE
jgi:small subunit ribosomal protein S2